MNVRARIGAASILAITMGVALDANRAAADEAVVKPERCVVQVEIDRRVFRNDIDAYVRALTDSLRDAVATPPKPASAAPTVPENVELAAARPRTRG